MRLILINIVLIIFTVNGKCQSVYNKLTEIAARLNKNVPIKIDSNTQVDSVVVLREDTLVYKCTLLRNNT